MNYSEQILKARFEQLPDDVRKAIIATPWKDKLAQIASKHRLHIDQADSLGKETIIVLFGLDHPDNLVYNIAKNLEVSEEKAEAIAEDLNREIFLKVRESLKGIFKEREGEENGSFLAGSLLGKKEGGAMGEEEILNKEDILREIEDKEHHNLPMINKSELHLGVQLPSEIKVFEKPAETNSFINESKSEEERKIFEKVNRNPNLGVQLPSKEGTIKTMPGDIFKLKMSGTVNVPKETVEIKESKVLPKVKLAGTSKKIDPYREEVR